VLKLRIVPAEGPPFLHELRGDSLVIGRAAGSDLALADPFLSRQHSRFFRRGERWFVEDLGSRNGTQVNGRPVHEPTEVLPGDAVQISGSTLTIVPPGGLPASPRAPASPGAPAALGEPAGLGAPAGAATDSTVFLRRLSAADLLEQQGAGAAAAAAQGEEALRRYAERLKLLNEVHQALGRSLTLDALLELILDRVFDHLRPEQGVIFLKRAHGSDSELVRAASRALDAGQAESVELLGSRSLAREVADKGAAALVLDAQTDVRLAGAESIMISGVRSLLAAPLLEREGTLGMIVLGSKVAVRQFNEEDLELLVSVASVAALYIRNLALAEEAAERRLLAEELALARRIQLALLPQSLPELAGWELLGGNTPSRGVSGDYFAVVTRAAGGDAASECVLMVADVSGKGMAASLLTASLEAFAAGPIEDGLPPEAICAKLSRLLYRRTPPEKYATAFVAALVVGSGALRYANAGHNPPLLVRAGGAVEELAATGVPIALLPGAAYEAREARLAPGDLLILYTDGIVEANNPEGEEYGIERLSDLCRRHRRTACAELAAALEADLEAFVRGVPFADDRTLVMARRLPVAGDPPAPDGAYQVQGDTHHD
jgi:sigma-B regulation protein RsbU (phosphoserine phosphatase)